jgi:hypothetical protein
MPDRTDNDHDHATDLEQHDAAAMPGGTMRNEPQHRPTDVIVNNEYDLIHIDDDDHHDDPPDYVLVRRDDYDNLAAALDHLADDADYYYDLVIAARKLIDHHDRDVHDAAVVKQFNDDCAPFLIDDAP